MESYSSLLNPCRTEDDALTDTSVLNYGSGLLYSTFLCALHPHRRGSQRRRLSIKINCQPSGGVSFQHVSFYFHYKSFLTRADHKIHVQLFHHVFVIASSARKRPVFQGNSHSIIVGYSPTVGSIYYIFKQLQHLGYFVVLLECVFV